MKQNKNTFKNNLKEFFKELSAAFILAILFLFLFVIGVAILHFLPEKAWDDLPIEIIVLVGFLVCLTVLYLISKTIYIIKKLKRKNKEENKQVNE